jgi:diphosphomevalonate decarboxylase
VPARLARIEQAYRERDFATFAQLTMQDSNQFHATCMDTYPPVFYMNDVSRKAIALVHKINEAAGATVAGYTFDAGPNAVIFLLREHAPLVLAAVKAHFPVTDDINQPFVSSAALDAEADAFTAAGKLPATLQPAPGTDMPGAIRHVYYTTPGDGPRVLDAAQALADSSTGMPFVVAASGEGKGEFSKAL